jgi:hypothetical protein
MKPSNKGFAIPLLILALAILIGLGVLVYIQGNTIKPLTLEPVACTEDARQCSDGSYVGRTGPNCEFVCPVSTSTSSTSTDPVISSISPSSGPIGTIIELRGTNLNGFEGDLDAIIENSKGESGYMLGGNSFITDKNLIKVKIESKICKQNNSYSGLPCESYLNITPGVYNIYTAPWGKISNKMQFTVTSGEQMSLGVYIQNKEIAKTSDCGVTKKIAVQVPKTTAVADASLKFLFGDELSAYGVYKSVGVSGGVAKVVLTSDNTPSGRPMGGLSSCESSHLMSVLKDTLTQYSTIKSVEIYSPKGKIEF